jgi:hypothetical protein
MDDNVAAVRRRFMSRPGYRLLDGRQVVFPLHSVSLRVFVVEKRPVPVIEEFLLKLISKGVRCPSELAGLLGVEHRIVHSRLVALRRDELIEIQGDAGSEPECHLTGKGFSLAHNLVQERLKEITLPNVMFHSLLNKPVSIGTASAQRYLRERDLPQDPPAIRIQPNGVRMPTEDDLTVGELNRVIDRSLHMRREHASVAAVRGIIDTGGMFFEPAVMLEYEARGDTASRSIRFVVDGVVREEYEEAFAAANGYEACRHLLTPHEETLRERLARSVNPAVLANLGDIEAAEEVSDQIVATEQELRDAQEAIKAVREDGQVASGPQSAQVAADRADTRQLLRQKLAEAEAVIATRTSAADELDAKVQSLSSQLASLQAKAAAMKVQRLWTTEIRHKFQEAIRDARERLLIISAFISSDVVNDAFVTQLDKLLRNGCRIWIGYGMDANNAQRVAERNRPAWRDAEDRLLELSERHGTRCVVRDLKGSHVKRVICDASFTIGGSYNYLSFRGERDRGGRLRQEECELIVDPSYCESLYAEYLRNKMFFG